MRQSIRPIVTLWLGAAMALALRFAGTWNNAAFETTEYLINKFIAVTKRSIADLTGKAVVEQTICILVLSQGMIMAGSGDLSTLRTCRMLRSRVHNSTVVNYGSHMAVHIAIGLLFLGGGRLALASSPRAAGLPSCRLLPQVPHTQLGQPLSSTGSAPPLRSGRRASVGCSLLQSIWPPARSRPRGVLQSNFCPP